MTISFFYLQSLFTFHYYSVFNLSTVICMFVVYSRLVCMCVHMHVRTCVCTCVRSCQCKYVGPFVFSLTVVQVIEHKCILKFKAGRLHIFSTLEFKWHLLHSLFVCINKTSIKSNYLQYSFSNYIIYNVFQY